MKRDPSGLELALTRWAEILSPDRVLIDDGTLRQYGANAIGVQREIAGVVKPTTVDEVVAVVKVANDLLVPLYPISAGKNWGYGSANPVIDGCVIVDLSLMDKILDVDSDLGVVTLQPGVTQEKLRVYLDETGLSFLVPVHGGGPDCSIVGNALERGYGITPYADHFGAVMKLEAILPDGTIYRSALEQNGGASVDSLFKWGVGPYIDGLFTQSNLGIVTSMTIALAPIPAKVYNFFFWVKKEEHLEASVLGLREVLKEVGANCGSINLMNRLRILSMMEPFPAAEVNEGGVIPESVVLKMAKRQKVTPWMGTGAIYANKRIASATKSAIRKKLGPACKFMLFLSPETVSIGKKFVPYIPGRLGQQVRVLMETIEETVKLIAGSPSEIALPLSYWRSGKMPIRGHTRMDPAKDGCGIVWYSPLVPMKPALVRDYVEMVKRVCIAHQVDPLITLTSLSDKLFDSTVPLLFERQDPDAIERVQLCYQALYDEGKKLGMLPYRMGVQCMDLLGTSGSSYWQTAQKIKSVIDPNQIIAPGRYEVRS